MLKNKQQIQFLSGLRFGILLFCACNFVYTFSFFVNIYCQKTNWDHAVSFCLSTHDLAYIEFCQPQYRYDTTRSWQQLIQRWKSICYCKFWSGIKSSICNISRLSKPHLGLTSKFEELSPPPGNKFDLEVGQRSRSPHGTNGKDLSQGSCMPNINALSSILQKLWARLKFLWQTDGQTDGQTDRGTDGRMTFKTLFTQIRLPCPFSKEVVDFINFVPMACVLIYMLYKDSSSIRGFNIIFIQIFNRLL